MTVDELKDASFIVSVWRGRINVCAAASSDAAFVAELKTWAEDRGYRVSVIDHSKPRQKA